MRTRRPIAQKTCPAHRHGERIKDEVYRQMFRLEEGRAGSEIALALALLRAWLAAGSELLGSEDHAWLKKVSALGVEMIEGSTQAHGPGNETAH